MKDLQVLKEKFTKLKQESEKVKPTAYTTYDDMAIVEGQANAYEKAIAAIDRFQSGENFSDVTKFLEEEIENYEGSKDKAFKEKKENEHRAIYGFSADIVYNIAAKNALMRCKEEIVKIFKYKTPTL